MVLTALGTALSQEKPRNACGFSFVNAVSLDTPTMLKLNADAYRPRGYKAGAITDGGMLYEGDYQLTVENADLDPVTLPISVKPGASPVYVAYLSPKILADGTEKLTLALAVLPNQKKPTNGRAFYGFYAAPNGSANIVVDGSPVSLPALKMVLLSEKARMSIGVGAGPEADKASRDRILSPEDSGNFVTVVYPAKEGLGFSTVKDQVIVESRMGNE